MVMYSKNGAFPIATLPIRDRDVNTGLTKTAEAVFEFRDMLGYIDVADPPVYDTSVFDLTWTGTGWQLVSKGS
jgi:hypothetical protein